MPGSLTDDHADEWRPKMAMTTLQLEMTTLQLEMTTLQEKGGNPTILHNPHN